MKTSKSKSPIYDIIICMPKHSTDMKTRNYYGKIDEFAPNMLKASFDLPPI